MIEVLHSDEAVMARLEHAERVLHLTDCPVYDVIPGDVNVRIDRVIAKVDREMTKVQWIELASKLMELLSGGGLAVIVIPANLLPSNLNIRSVMVAAGLEHKENLLAEKCMYFTFKRKRNGSTWGIEGELRRQGMAARFHDQ